MFSWVCALPSPTSAEGCPSLFGWFTGITAQSDFSCTFASAVRFMATRYSIDIGLGHLADIPFINSAFSWLPNEFQAPIPSFPNAPSASSVSP